MKKINDKDRRLLDSILADYGLSTEKILAAVTSRQFNEVLQRDSEQASTWISRSAAAKLASVSVDTIDNWRNDGRVSSIKLNRARAGRVLIDKASLLAYLNSFVRTEVAQ